MKGLRGVVLVLVVATISLLSATSATGTASTSPLTTRHTQARIEALAIDGDRIAYDVGSTLGKANNQVLVWNVRTGKTTTVSGKGTRTIDDSSTGSGVFRLAIAGTRVAWMANVGGNSEGDDYLFSSSVTKPKEHKIASEQRIGDNCAGRTNSRCAGRWLGGLVGSGNLIALNRWFTDSNGFLVNGELDALTGTQLKSVATGGATVEAAAADAGRVVVPQFYADAPQFGADVAVYSSSGKFLLTVPSQNVSGVGLSGHNLVVLTTVRQLELWDTRNGQLLKRFPAHGSAKQLGNVDVQGNVAIYSTGSSVYAVNLSTGKNRVIGKLGGGIGFARISSAGVVYSNSRLASEGTLVFVPIARVSAAVS